MSLWVRDANGHVITPEVVLEAYRQRCFPMAEHRSGRLDWYRPLERAIITWDRFRVPKSLRSWLRRGVYRVTFDRAFASVIAACARREETWISYDIQQLYQSLHASGYAHSVEAWDQAGVLVGGLYGLQLGACFCGESMFHERPNASKICLVHLVEHLQQHDFQMLDCQQDTPHMRRFGALVISDSDYALRLRDCLVQASQPPAPWSGEA